LSFHTVLLFSCIECRKNKKKNITNKVKNDKTSKRE
jgi:hypothetical protein